MTTSTAPALPPAFTVPDDRRARVPPVLRGPGGIRMLGAWRSSGEIAHGTLGDLPDLLRAGDVLVVNDSAVLPAAVEATRPDGRRALVHFSTTLPGGDRLAEVRVPAGEGTLPALDAAPAERLVLPGGGAVHLERPWAPGPAGRGVRLWVARVDLDVGLEDHLARHGRPIRYASAAGGWPLTAYQTMFAARPGSVEPPSAALGFTPGLVARLRAGGVDVVAITLHTAVSSQEADERPSRSGSR